MNHAIDAPRSFTFFGGLANTGSALNIRVHPWLTAFSRIKIETNKKRPCGRFLLKRNNAYLDWLTM
jgi:hypothetical protein